MGDDGARPLTPVGRRPAVEARADGTFSITLDGDERALLASLPDELRQLLATDDPALDRLFPPAYTTEPELEDEFRALTRPDLLRAKTSALAIMEATVDAHQVSEDELVAWLAVLNDLRLVLGTRLEVAEDLYEQRLADDDPRLPALALYLFLGALQEEVVEALAAELPEDGSGP